MIIKQKISIPQTNQLIYHYNFTSMYIYYIITFSLNYCYFFDDNLSCA